MRFSEQHGIARPDEADWFDANVEMDSPLYVDPFLIFDDTDSHWMPARHEIVDFFDAVLDLLKRADGHRNSMHWVKAQRFLHFPEPKEFALGHAMGNPEGRGIGSDLARGMCDGLEFFRERGRGSDDRLLAMLAVLVPGMGVDRISDMVCNILKGRFITYTQDVCQCLGVPVANVTVANASWTSTGCRWTSNKVTLPASPVFNGGVLLTPQRFLKDIPRVTPDGFWGWAEHNENEKLRFNLNYDLAQSLSQREKARLGRELAHRDVDMLERYVDDATGEVSAYEVDRDPEGLVHWEEAGRELARASVAPNAPASQDQFEEWLTALAMTFKTAVEDNALWCALWNDGNTSTGPSASPRSSRAQHGSSTVAPRTSISPAKPTAGGAPSTSSSRVAGRCAA